MGSAVPFINDQSLKTFDLNFDNRSFKWFKVGNASIRFVQSWKSDDVFLQQFHFYEHLSIPSTKTIIKIVTEYLVFIKLVQRKFDCYKFLLQIKVQGLWQSFGICLLE